MLNSDLLEAENSLSNIKKAFRIVNMTLKVIFVLFCLYWLIVIGSTVYAYVIDATDKPDFLPMCLYFSHGVVIALLLLTFIGIFSDVVVGRSPFTMIQVRRLRIIAGLLLMYAVIDFAVTANAAIFKYDELVSGYVSTTGNEIIPINLALIFGAGVMFAFSFVFKYGVLLQEFSDETL